MIMGKVSQKVIEEELRNGLKEGIATFDVRDYIMKKVAMKMVAEAYPDNEKYQAGCDSSDVIRKTLIGKKYANSIDYDYDTCIFTMAVFRELMFKGKDKEIVWANEHKERYNEVRLKVGDIIYRGDTMNSWATTMNTYKHEGERPNIVYTYSEDPEDKSPNKPPEYVENFMNVVYTIGNFIPVPVGQFNMCRGRNNNRINDYWDLTLLAICDYYAANRNDIIKKGMDKLAKDTRIENTISHVRFICAFPEVKEWLDYFDSWDEFVKQNFMQPFIDFDKEIGYRLPRELWKSHFQIGGKPEPGPSRQQFFENAHDWILERGLRIAEALKQ